jgi:hypothetical protein
MSCISIDSFKLAAGNNNVGGLQSIATILGAVVNWPANKIAVKSYGSFSGGIRRTRPDGLIYQAGFPSFDWVFGLLVWEQEELIRNTYCSGGVSGLVTARSNTDNDFDSFANYNAVLNVLDLAELTQGNNRTIRNYRMRFIKVVAL